MIGHAFLGRFRDELVVPSFSTALVRISLGMVEELQLPIDTEEEGEITLHQVLM